MICLNLANLKVSDQSKSFKNTRSKCLKWIIQIIGNLGDIPKLTEDSFLLQYGIEAILTYLEHAGDSSNDIKLKTYCSTTLFKLARTQNLKVIDTMERHGIIDM